MLHIPRGVSSMRKSFLVSLLFALVFTACSRSSEPGEVIKITPPVPEKGKTIVSWEIVRDSWADEADRDLVREIRQALTEGQETVAFAEGVAIEAADGSIVLRGSGAYVMTRKEWQTVGRRAKAVKGVKSIEIESLVAAGE